MRKAGGVQGPVLVKNQWAGKLAAVILAGAGLMLAGCGSETEVGAGIYAERCLSCHGAVGAGDGGRAAFLPGGVSNLRESRLLEEELRGVVSKGRKLMPAFGPALKKEEIRSVVAFIQGFQKR